MVDGPGGIGCLEWKSVCGYSCSSIALLKLENSEVISASFLPMKCRSRSRPD